MHILQHLAITINCFCYCMQIVLAVIGLIAANRRHYLDLAHHSRTANLARAVVSPFQQHYPESAGVTYSLEIHYFYLVR